MRSLQSGNVFFIASPKVKKAGVVAYFSVNFKNMAMLVEVTLNAESTNVCVRSSQPAVSAFVAPAIAALLTQ